MSLAALTRVLYGRPVVDDHLLAIRTEAYKALTGRDFDDDSFDVSDGCGCEEACCCRAQRERFERSQKGLRIASAKRAVYAAQLASDIAERWGDADPYGDAERAEMEVVYAFGTNDVDLCVRSCLQSKRRSKRVHDGASKVPSGSKGPSAKAEGRRRHPDGKSRDVVRRYHNCIIRDDAQLLATGP